MRVTRGSPAAHECLEMTARSPAGPPTAGSPLADLGGRATVYWVAQGLIAAREVPDYSPVVDRLIQVVGALGLPDLAALTAHSADLLLTLTGATDLCVDHPEPVPQALHTYRNLIAALVATDALLRGAPVVLPAALPRLRHRTRLKAGRPLENDERLLLRLVVHARARDDAKLLGATRYVLTEAGAKPGESTAIYPPDLNHPERPTHVWAPGNHDRRRRLLPLDAWGSAILGRRVRQHAQSSHPDRPLAFDGRAPGSSQATMSAHRSLDKLLDAAGLSQLADVTASSIAFQAAYRTAKREGNIAAFALLGRKSTDQALRDLRGIGSHPSAEEASVRSFLDHPFPAYRGSGTPASGKVKRRRP
jgi:hypothetical protein